MKQSLKLVNYNVILPSLVEKNIPHTTNDDDGIVTFEGDEYKVSMVVSLVKILDLTYSKLIKEDQKLAKKRQAELN